MGTAGVYCNLRFRFFIFSYSRSSVNATLVCCPKTSHAFGVWYFYSWDFIVLHSELFLLPRRLIVYMVCDGSLSEHCTLKFICILSQSGSLARRPRNGGLRWEQASSFIARAMTVYLHHHYCLLYCRVLVQCTFHAYKQRINHEELQHRLWTAGCLNLLRFADSQEFTGADPALACDKN